MGNGQHEIHKALGQVLYACEENQKALERVEDHERSTLQSVTQLQSAVNQQRKEIDNLTKQIMGSNGKGLVRQVDHLESCTKKQKWTSRKALAYTASPGLLVLLERIMAWINK